ncbi:unnamed protein product [Allacma fusca]|uniref:Uncharacterized protein n=1 Tax=Allacma fusca TaxID=39272 RepID=A0A8J2PUG2_9HEXA|nr:unnamed protein product [Allacma fusca]
MKTSIKLRVQGQLLSAQTFYLFIVIFYSAFILQCAFCKETTEHTSTSNQQDLGSIQGWNSWEPASKTAGLNWTPVEARHEETSKSKGMAHNQKINSRQKGRPEKMSLDSDFNLNDLRKKVFTYGKYLFNFVTGSNSNLGLRTFFPDSLSSGHEGSDRSFGGSWKREGGGRGAIDWLARLIGVEGKTLGEFLREYQVHVLYDLVFTFFKWIFFLYAGLLIP